tara:strand:- start:460 stop:1218 length:759 start_codon:yes stop_codon:yes gene_type:complete
MQKSKTQIGLLGLVEKFVRKFVTIYYFIRSIAIKFDIFEEDFKILRKIFNNRKINVIDIGASDGISANFFIKNLNVNNIYCFEPHFLFIEKLKKLKKKNKNIKIFNYGISTKNENIEVYIPKIFFFNKALYLYTYTFYNLKELKKQLSLDFLNYKKILIEKVVLKLRKFKSINNNIHLIKIDVNGYEFEIVKCLKTQITKNLPLMVIENNKKIKKISKLLSNYGYRGYYNNNGKLERYTNQKVLDIFFIAKK